ncbi:MAG TPA: TetR family transcriptional regulator [Acidimicrobiales bacterium]
MPPVSDHDAVDDGAADGVGLRARKKSATRRALIDAAIDLFGEQGFEDTTVEEIAARVGVSGRTFHRYFPRKEDVVLADSSERLEWFRARLAERTDAATALESVRDAVVATVVDPRTDVEAEQARLYMRARARVMAATPTLRAHNVAIHDDWVLAVATHAAAMVGEEPTDRWPALFGACTMAAIAVANTRWWTDPDVDLVEEYTAVLELLQGLDRPSVIETPTEP